jgi:hypothetical protein
MKKSLILFTLAFSASASAATPHLSDAQFNAQFRCPESLPSSQARDQEVHRFINWVQQNHGDWTILQLSTFRMQLLENHDCKQTLDNIRAHDRQTSQTLGNSHK